MTVSRKIITNTNSRHISVVLDHPEKNKKKDLATSFRNVIEQNSALENRAGIYQAIQELDHLVGLDEVKELVYEIFAFIFINQKRFEVGLRSDPQVLHMVFKGNPGTGKTTVARIMGKILREMGILSKGHLIEVERADLVGEYIGHTAQKTREMIKKAMGGILFIDEAYSLARGGEKDFGRETIDTIVKAMEDLKNNFILILAGYEYEMDQFLRANPGLPSRFPIKITFPDYTIDELLLIAEKMCEERQYQLAPTSQFKLKQYLMDEMKKPYNSFSNARFVRNILEKAIRFHAVRMVTQSQVSREELMTIRSEDIRVSTL